jgi:hypothetical protein
LVWWGVRPFLSGFSGRKWGVHPLNSEKNGLCRMQGEEMGPGSFIRKKSALLEKETLFFIHIVEIAR